MLTHWQLIHSELVGFEGGEVIPDVLTSSDAALHAVVGNPVQRNEDGDVSGMENVTLKDRPHQY